jgi:hypothetical protein
VNLVRNFPRNVTAAIAVSAALMCGISASAWADTPAKEGMQGMHADMAKHHQEMMKAGLSKAADRLEIKASQQGAWQAFAKVIEDTMGMPPKMQMPDSNADAATLTRHHADIVAARAKSMAQIADATAKLQEALTPEQRTTLTQIVRQFAQAHQMGGQQHGPMGMHGQMGMMHGQGNMPEMCREMGQHKGPGMPHE